MTVGKDVSMLFPDVVKNLETPNMELKKLIYLYIINYAKYRPDQIVMAINTLRKVIFINIYFYIKRILWIKIILY